MRVTEQSIDVTLALEDVYRRRFDQLCRVAAAVTGDREAAPDLVHDAFVRAVRNAATFEGRGSADAWVLRILLNLARNHRRGARPTEGLSGYETSAQADSSDPQLDQVATAVAALPERQRLVLFLRYYADLDYEAIAETLGIRPGTVGAALSAARSALAKSLTDWRQA